MQASGPAKMIPIALLSAVLALCALVSSCAGPGRVERLDPARRWFFLSRDLSRAGSLAEAEAIMRRAREAGYNGLLFSDVKALVWWTLDDPEGYRENAAALRALASELGLELAVAVFPFQWSQSFGALDPNLAAGVPVRRAPLVRRGGELVPEETAKAANGSFETYRGDKAAGWSLQDGPGRVSFIDTTTAGSGGASLRFDCGSAMNRHGHGRIFQKIEVRPWQQYRIRVRFKAERLDADLVQVVALAGRRPLQYESLSIPGGAGAGYFSRADGLTTDWIEQTVAFNSLRHTVVTVGAGIWGGRSGSIWWDDLRVEAVPALNVIRRGTAPLSVVDGGGAELREGIDFERVSDPLLGRSRRPGTYDVRHDPPRVAVPLGSRVAEGERVFLSCYHPVIFYAGQVPCTLDDPGIFERCAEEIRRVDDILSPDCWFMSHDEIRCAGWEPSPGGSQRSPGEILARNAARCVEIIAAEGGGGPVFVWSDMFDPYHNARSSYYLANGSFAGSWKGLDPKVVAMVWGTPENAGKRFRFFDGLGNRTMIAAYYDSDVAENRRAWSAASAGSRGVEGVMYTTWRDDYSMLEEFADAWWGGAGRPDAGRRAAD